MDQIHNKDRISHPKVAHDKSHLIKTKQHAEGQLLALRELYPTCQERINLGLYSQHKPPKGFVVEYEPEIKPKNLVASQITATPINESGMYSLVMEIVNFSDKTISVKVWKL